MGLFGKLAEDFSWRLAAVFIAAGVAAAVVAELVVSDYDRGGFVESDDGLRLAYEIQGAGSPLVALAGGPGISHHGFHPYLGGLRHQVMVVYFDPRGRGASDGAATYSVGDEIRDLEALRRGLGLARLDLLGVSYGAHLAAAYALEHPERVRRLVLVSPLVGRRAWRQHLRLLLEAPGMDATMQRIRSRRGRVLLSDVETADQVVRRLLPLYWCDPRQARRAASPFRRWHRTAHQNFQVYEDIVGRPFGELNGDLARSDVDQRLDRMEAPTLIVQGGCDRVVPQGHVAWLVRRLVRARVVPLDGAGHSPFVDAPRRFIEEVGGFLAEPWEGSGAAAR